MGTLCVGWVGSKNLRLLMKILLVLFLQTKILNLYFQVEMRGKKFFNMVSDSQSLPQLKAHNALNISFFSVINNLIIQLCARLHQCVCVCVLKQGGLRPCETQEGRRENSQHHTEFTRTLKTLSAETLK